MTDVLWWVWIAELAAAATLIVACVGCYHHATGGAWRASEEGRHLMAFMMAIAFVLVPSLVRVLAVGGPIDPDRVLWSAAVRDLAFAPILPVFAWRLSIVLRAGHPTGQASPPDGPPDDPSN